MNSYIDQFKNKTVVIIGDLVLDEYWFGGIDRISREAPVLILDYEYAMHSLGGAANAAHNIASLGATVIPIAVIGSDASGKTMQTILREKNILLDGLITDDAVTTPTKIRVMAGCLHTAKQQVLRIDRRSKEIVSHTIEQSIIQRIKTLIGNADAVLISDYALGTLSPSVIEMLSQSAREMDIPFVVDSRTNVCAYHHVSIVTPNEEEAARALHMPITEDNVEHATRMLRERVDADAALITMGKAGMALATKHHFVRIPAVGPQEAMDVTGAGDTVCAVLTLARASGASYDDAARLANIAASEVVMHRGTAVVTPEQLKELVEKYSSIDQA